MDGQETRRDAGKLLGRVLVVEDDTKLLDLFARALVHAGYECARASSGDQALWSVLAESPEVVVLDVMIPHPSGLEVCRHLRARRWPGGVVVVSARANPEDREAAARAGADAFLGKPFPIGALVAAVDALMPGRVPDRPTSRLLAPESGRATMA
jgi:two-component system response regulator MprA